MRDRHSQKVFSFVICFAVIAALCWPRLATAQAITEFTIPTANSSPAGIKAGPDGALWFTEAAANKIGRITTAGLSDRLLHVELERVFERNVIRHEYRSKRG
jgi:streptogramin lyase